MINSFYVVPRIGALAYLNIGKSACSSILLALSRMRVDENFEPPRNTLPDGSESIHGFFPPYSHMEHFFRRWPLSYPPLPSSFIRFTFVRNPYDRFYSFYKSKIIEGQTPVAFYERIGIKKGCSFEECVHRITSIDPNNLEHHIAPQSMIIFKEGDLLIDFVGRLESINKDWLVIQKLSGYRVSLERANVTQKPNQPVYSTDLKDRIYRYYRDDFELFDYEKDSVSVSNDVTEIVEDVHSSHRLSNTDLVELKDQISASNDRIHKLAEAFDEDPEKRHKYFKQQEELHHEMILKDVWSLEERLNQSNSAQSKYSQIQSTFSSELKSLRDDLKKRQEISSRQGREISETIQNLATLKMNLLDKTTKYEKAMNLVQSGLDILQEKAENNWSNIDDLKFKSDRIEEKLTEETKMISNIQEQTDHLNLFATRIEEGMLEGRDLITRIEQELRTFRKNAWKSINVHGESLRNKEARINQNRKKCEDLENQLNKKTLIDYVHARNNIWRRLYRFICFRTITETKILLRSGLVDPHFYFSTYPDTISAGMSAAQHYVRFGAQEGKDPSKHFNTVEYLAEHPDVAHEGINPLVHFILGDYQKVDRTMSI